MILFFSDIKYGDTRSAFKMMLPLLNVVKKKNSIILAPNSLQYVSEGIVSFTSPFYKSKLLPLRLLSEVLMPILAFLKLLSLKRKQIKKIDKIIIYSPSIFTCLLLIFIKTFFRQKILSYLILRDIFPDWAVDAGVIKNKYLISFFRFFAQLQFTSFDYIGVEDASSLVYLKKKYKLRGKVEVLRNWVPETNYPKTRSINYSSKIKLYKNRLNVIYTGNLGPAQNSENLFKAFHFISGKLNHDLSIHIFGHGLEYQKLRKYSIKKKFLEIIFWGSISSEECDEIIKKCDGAFFCLNSNLITNNIPGKYMNYIKFSLPVFAVVKKNNPIFNQINVNNIGVAISDTSVDDIALGFLRYIHKLLDKKFSDPRKIFNKNYSFKNAAKPILDWLE